MSKKQKITDRIIAITHKIWHKAKTFVLGTLIGISPINALASAHNAPNGTKPAIQNTINKIDSLATNPLDSFCFSGQRYNDKCNGSLCWLSSKFETKDAGVGKYKNTPSIAMFSTNKKYRGINQMDISNTRKFAKYLKKLAEMSDSAFAETCYLTGKYPDSIIQKIHKDEQDLSQLLNRKNGLSEQNWKRAVKKHEQVATFCNEWFLVSNYSPECFERIQEKINNKGVAVSVKKLHPAILSALHRRVIQSPYTYANNFCDKLFKFIELSPNNINNINSEEFIKTAFPRNLADETISLFNDSTQQWNQMQFLVALQKVKPEHTDDISWFDQHEKKGQDQYGATLAKQAIKDAYVAEPSTLTVANYIPELTEARNLSAQQKRRKIELHKKIYQQQYAANNQRHSKKNSRPANLQDKRIENAVLRATEHSNA